MTNISMMMMRAGTLAIALAAGTLVGCSAPDPTMTAQGTRILGSSGISLGGADTGPYSGLDADMALDAAMTSDNGGE